MILDDLFIGHDNAALTIATETGTVTYSAATDPRIKYLGGCIGSLPVVIARSERAAAELASEARVWGVAGKVRFAV